MIVLLRRLIMGTNEIIMIVVIALFVGGMFAIKAISSKKDNK